MPVHVVVTTHHDFLDYLAAYSGAVGGAAAVVALIFAGLSKRDAARSAEAAKATQELADEQVRIMRDEAAAAKAERDRRGAPEIYLGAEAFEFTDDSPPRFVVLTAGFSNDNGTRAIDRLVVNLRAPAVLELRACSDRWGNGSGNGQIHDLPSVVLGDKPGALFWTDAFGPIARFVHEVRFLKIGAPRPGSYRIEAELVNEDLPGGHSQHVWQLDIPDRGGWVALEPILIQPVRTDAEQDDAPPPS
jgi:hypothetical protein